MSRVVWAQNEPDLCRSTNEQGTLNVFRLAAQYSVPWVLFASSREVYGQQSVPVSETAALKPMNVYARSKVRGEEIALSHRACGVRSAVIRFSNVYGSVEDHADRVVPAFCRAAAQNTPMYLEGPDNIFDFTHVNDVVEGTYRLIQLLMDGVRRLSPVHLVSGIGTSLSDLAELACKGCTHLPKRTVRNPRNFDVSTFVGDPHFAKELLGWEARTSLEKGVQAFVQQFALHAGR